MSRNRMKNSQSLHWMGVVKWVMIFGVIAGLGLGYMLCKNQNMRLAKQGDDMQHQLNTIEARNTELAADLHSMRSMKLLEKRLALMHSSLVPWGDPRAMWVRLDQNTRARLARTGTMPNAVLNFESLPVASSRPATSTVAPSAARPSASH